MIRLLILTSISLFYLGTSAFAYYGGVCKSLSSVYKDVDFSIEGSANLQYALDFKKSHNGQLITDGSKEMYYVIWNSQVTAPETQYTCARVSED